MATVGNIASKAEQQAAQHGAHVFEQEAKGFSPLGFMGSMASKLSTAAFVIPLAGAVAGFLGKRTENVKALSLLSKGAKLAHEASGLLNKPIGELGQATGSVFKQAADSISHDGVSRALSRSGATVENALRTGIEKYGQRILGVKLHERVKGASVANVAVTGFNAVSEAANMGLSLKSRITALKAMQADLTGKAPSTWSVIMGGKNLDPMVAHVRKQALGGKGLLSYALQAAGVAGNIALSFSNGKGVLLKSIGLNLATSMGANMLSGNADAALTGYSAMTKEFAVNGKASAESYISLIGGLAPGANEQVAREIATSAYTRQLLPKQVITMVSESFLNPRAARPVVGEGKFTGALAAENARGMGRGMTPAYAGI